jgi:hypothetical protein
MGHFGRPAITLAWLILVFPACVLSLVSRSRMRNRNAEIRSSRSAMRLRADCVVHAIVGCAVTPRMWTSAGDFHDEQDVESAQPDGVEVEEVRGE